jgi:hypothetical protein
MLIVTTHNLVADLQKILQLLNILLYRAMHIAFCLKRFKNFFTEFILFLTLKGEKI